MNDDSDRSRKGTAGGPDPEALRELRERIEELQEAAAEVRTLGAEHGVPAVERDAKRVEDVAATLEMNVPAELFKTDGSDRTRGEGDGES